MLRKHRQNSFHTSSSESTTSSQTKIIRKKSSPVFSSSAREKFQNYTNANHLAPDLAPKQKKVLQVAAHQEAHLGVQHKNSFNFSKKPPKFSKNYQFYQQPLPYFDIFDLSSRSSSSQSHTSSHNKQSSSIKTSNSSKMSTSSDSNFNHQAHPQLLGQPNDNSNQMITHLLEQLKTAIDEIEQKQINSNSPINYDSVLSRLQGVLIEISETLAIEYSYT